MIQPRILLEVRQSGTTHMVSSPIIFDYNRPAWICPDGMGQVFFSEPAAFSRQKAPVES